jgi:hypothetical protein
MRALSMYTKKREWLRRLSLVNDTKVKEWLGMDRQPVYQNNNEVNSVFRNSTATGP